MSAIWGIVSLDRSDIDSNSNHMDIHYKKYCKIDRYQTIELPDIYMGCGIQHITNEANEECLPIYDEANDIIFNADCLLDNRQELCKLLNISLDRPDGHLMYNAYLKWGIQCVSRFRGLFSLAIYDRKKQELHLASDQLSCRSLYYYRSGNTIAFSTLIQPIRNLYPAIPVNENYLKDFLTAPGLMPNIVAHETPWLNVFQLNPGEYITLSKAGLARTSYWNPEKEGKYKKCKNARQYQEAFYQLYQDCVTDALRCNGNVGISMSSGLDSATVGVLATKKLQEKGLPLMTYTFVPFYKSNLNTPRNHVTDETEDVLSIQRMYPNMVPHFLNNEGKNCLDSLPDSLSIMEIPFKAFANLPNLREIYQAAANDGCKILLSGQCGNSTVSHGYIDDILYDLCERGHYLKFLRYLNRYSKTVGESRKQALVGCMRYFRYTRKQYRNKQFSYQPTNSFLTKNILENYPLEERFCESGNRLLTNIPISSSFYRSSLYKAAIYTYMGNLETKMGLHYGIIIRDPTKDMRMMSFCYQIPYEYFARLGTPRWLIRSSFHELLPANLINDWMRYGLQNADYMERIGRDLDSLLEGLRSNLTSLCYTDWIDHKRITDYLTNLSKMRESNSTYSEPEAFDNFCYIYILQLFLNQNNKA